MSKTQTYAQEFWCSIALANDERVRQQIQHLRETAILLEQSLEQQDQWHNEREKYGLDRVLFDNRSIRQLVSQIIRASQVSGSLCTSGENFDELHNEPASNNVQKKPCKKDAPARRDNLTIHTAQESGLLSLFGGSEDLSEFATHLNDMTNTLPPTETQSSASTLVKRMIETQATPEELAKQIEQLSTDDIVNVLADIPDPQKEIDNIMQERRLQSLVLENDAQSNNPVRFITSVDGHEQNKTADIDPPPANVLASLTRTQRDTLLVEIYSAAKKLVMQMTDVSVLQQGQLEELINKQADRMLSAYIEKNK